MVIETVSNICHWFQCPGLLRYLKKDPQLFGRSVLPPCLMMNPPAEEEEDFAQSNGNVDGKAGWWLEPLVWGPKWLIISFLLVTVFNHKWADIKYYQFDSRDHFGFGTWSTCCKLRVASCPLIFLTASLG